MRSKKKKKNNLIKRKRLHIILIVIFVVILGTGISQLAASTPSIVDEMGNKVEGSISLLEQVELNGSKQWITIRGYNNSNPVLLFLAGGPGGSQIVETRNYFKDLEKDFIVVNWEQPGSGKSFGAVDQENLNKERYIEDAHALTKHLEEYFNEDKIFIMGQSWGTALSLWLAERYPEDYYGIINSGQMVDFLETEKICYESALTLAKKNKDEETVTKLEEQGAPPYYGEKMVMKASKYLMYLSKEMNRNTNIHGPGYSTINDVMSREYGIIDKINYFRGMLSTFNRVYQQLYDISLIEDVPKIDVPVYILHGIHDLNAPTELVEEYYQYLEAPNKELIWFEHSGHTPWRSETERFVDEVIKIKDDILKVEINTD
ncbi:alpha/beta hydrolase [Mycoplasmatota bacterium]|nr:alpha/beta hydrolase [Mycoplasmatota bacterium]